MLMLKRETLLAAALVPLALAAPAYAWPSLTESATAIHIELPAVLLPPLDAASIHYQVRPQALHFPPIDVNLPKGLAAIKTPAELVEKVLYNVAPQFVPWAMCTLAGSANDEDLTKEQSEACENAVYAQMKSIGIAMITAAQQQSKQLDEAVTKFEKGAPDSKTMNEPAVESICQDASYAGCEVIAPLACKSVIATAKNAPTTEGFATHVVSPAGRQAACENETTSACATLMQAVCETAGHVTSMQKGGSK
jgi:hypothetical protein